MSEVNRQSRFERGNDVVVVKFGGTSVQDEAAIRRLIEIVRGKRGVQPVVVVSALAKVTDQLLEAGKAASSGHLGAALAASGDIAGARPYLEKAAQSMDASIRDRARQLLNKLR